MTNLTSGGNVQQIVHLCGEVRVGLCIISYSFCLVQGVLKPFCDLLAAKDDKVVCVVLDGVTNILTTAEKLGEVDKVAMMVEECGGLDRIEALQSHENETIYHKALQIIESFFTGDDQVSVGVTVVIDLTDLLQVVDEIAPKAGDAGYEFTTEENTVPQSGFNF